MLAGQETTIKNGTKAIYDSIWDKCLKIQGLFLYSTIELIAGEDAPYFRITNARKGFEIQPYIPSSMMQILGWQWNDTKRVIPDWVQFKVKPNAYAKKHGYKPYVNLMVDSKNDFVFEDGNTVKEFSNCIVVIKKYRDSISIHSPLYVLF